LKFSFLGGPLENIPLFILFPIMDKFVFYWKYMKKENSNSSILQPQIFLKMIV